MALKSSRRRNLHFIIFLDPVSMKLIDIETGEISRILECKLKHSPELKTSRASSYFEKASLQVTDSRSNLESYKLADFPN